MADLKMMIVDDDDIIRELIPQFLHKKGIKCEAYSTAEELLARLFPSAINEPSYMPDLIIIDLQLDKGKIQGIELIKELTTRDAPCELMAISGAIPSSDFTDDIICFGAAILLAKPFELEQQFYPRVKRLAEIGKKRRMKSVENPCEFHDDSRRYRPVFLSYADEDRQLATGIRRHLESYNINVWYAPTAISLGCEWNKEIKKGVKDACIFIPLISDHFIASDMCLNELNSFRNRMDQQSKRGLLLLPVVGDLSNRSRNSEVFKSIASKYQYSQLRPRASDCLTTLIWRIQAHL